MKMDASWIELARKYYPNASDSILSNILWSTTCFPFGTSEQVEKDLIEISSQTDDPIKAIEIVAENLMKEWGGPHE